MPKEQVIELSVEETNELRVRLGLSPLRGTAIKAAPPLTALHPDSGEIVLEMSMDESNDLRAQLGLSPLRSSENSKVIHAPAIHEGQVRETAERIAAAKLQREVQKGISKFAKNKLEENSTAKDWAARIRSTKPGNEGDRVSSTVPSSDNDKQQYNEGDLEGLQVAHAVEELAEGSTTVLTLSDVSLLQQDENRKVVGLNDEDEQQLENVQLAERRKIEKGLKEKRRVEMGMGRAGGYAGFDDDEFEELGGSQAIGSNLEVTKNRKRKGFQIGAHWGAEEEETDLFAAGKGKAISLETKADVTAADFMTEEEANAEAAKKATFKRKDKKEEEVQKSKRRDYDSEDEEEKEKTNSNELISELEATADGVVAHKKRRRSSDDEENAKESDAADVRLNRPNKRSQYDAAVERGNQRTNQIFVAPKKPVAQDDDAEPDDAFLDAALDKARRLHRLKAISGLQRSGAASVVQAVQNAAPKLTVLSGGVEFLVDETREFTRAFADSYGAGSAGEKKDDKLNHTSNASIKEESDAIDTAEPIEELSEMAKSVTEDTSDIPLEGVTGATTSIGRGVGSFLQLCNKLVKAGRAKDEKTYEDYERLDLSQVVRLDMKTATDKDKELAQREVKLEYRDSHGRLLTRKEAFRELCYQFHGHGSGKRKEEKKLQQIAREQAEARAARQDHTLGALKATQKATGKAFVVHKT